MFLAIPFMALSLFACNEPEEEYHDYVLENWDTIVETIASKGFTMEITSSEEFIDADVVISTEETYKYDTFNNREYSLVKGDQEGVTFFEEMFIDYEQDEGTFVSYSRNEEFKDYSKNTHTFRPGMKGVIIDGKNKLGKMPEDLTLSGDVYVSLLDDCRTEYKFDDEYNFVSITIKYDVVHDEDDEIPGRCHGIITRTISKIGETVVLFPSPSQIVE